MVALPSTDLQQSPLYTISPPWSSVDITCSTSRPLQGVFLKQTWPNNTDVIYYEDGMNATVDQRFQGRVNFTGSQDNLTITMSLLQLADSGIYTCLAVTDRDIVGPGTLVMVTVTGKERAQPRDHFCLLLPRPGSHHPCARPFLLPVRELFPLQANLLQEAL